MQLARFIQLNIAVTPPQEYGRKITTTMYNKKSLNMKQNSKLHKDANRRTSTSIFKGQKKKLPAGMSTMLRSPQEEAIPGHHSIRLTPTNAP